MSAESARAMMILPMDIIRNCSTQGDKLSARTNGQKPTFWDGKAKKLLKRHACFSFKNSSAGIKCDDSIKKSSGEQRSFIIEADVPIRATLTEGKEVYLLVCKFREKRLCPPLERMLMMNSRGIPSP